MLQTAIQIAAIAIGAIWLLLPIFLLTRLGRIANALERVAATLEGVHTQVGKVAERIGYLAPRR